MKGSIQGDSDLQLVTCILWDIAKSCLHTGVTWVCKGVIWFETFAPWSGQIFYRTRDQSVISREASSRISNSQFKSVDQETKHSLFSSLLETKHRLVEIKVPTVTRAFWILNFVTSVEYQFYGDMLFFLDDDKRQLTRRDTSIRIGRDWVTCNILLIIYTINLDLN